MTEDEMARWHHQFDGHEFEWTPGVGDGQGGLACCNSWGHKESDMTERLNWTELNWFLSILYMPGVESSSMILWNDDIISVSCLRSTKLHGGKAPCAWSFIP